MEQGTATYGPNMFADVTEEEFKANYLSKIPGVKLTKNMPLAADLLSTPPTEIEWNTKGAYFIGLGLNKSPIFSTSPGSALPADFSFSNYLLRRCNSCKEPR